MHLVYSRPQLLALPLDGVHLQVRAEVLTGLLVHRARMACSEVRDGEYGLLRGSPQRFIPVEVRITDAGGSVLFQVEDEPRAGDVHHGERKTAQRLCQP